MQNPFESWKVSSVYKAAFQKMMSGKTLFAEDSHILNESLLIGAPDSGFQFQPTDAAQFEALLKKHSLPRQLASVVNRSWTNGELIRRTFPASAGWQKPGQKITTTENVGTFDRLTIKGHQLAAQVIVDADELHDSAFTTSAILEGLAEAAGRLETESFISGTGDGQPHGILSCTDIITYDVDDDEYVSGAWVPKVQYQLSEAIDNTGDWVIHPTACASLRLSGDLRWDAGNERLMGGRVFSTTAVPLFDENIIGIYGDFRSYVWTQIGSATIKRQDELFLNRGGVGYRLNLFEDGAIIDRSRLIIIRRKDGAKPEDEESTTEE